MLLNSLKISIRLLFRDKVYSAVNIIGMSTALISVLVITSFIYTELSFDKFYNNYESIYRVTEHWEDDGRIVKSAQSHAPLVNALNGQLTDLEHITRVFPMTMVLHVQGGSLTKESGFIFADSAFLKIFNFKRLSGSLEEALKTPFSVVLTRSAAMKYFGTTENILGREMIYDGERSKKTFTVKGLIDDVPENTHLKFEILGSFGSLKQLMPWYNNWQHPSMYVYLKTNQPLEKTTLETRINRLAKRNIPDNLRDQHRSFHIQSIANIHLHSDLENEWAGNSDSKYLRILGLIVLFILLVATLNFININTARTMKRAQGIMMRKTFGARKSQIIVQFLTESTITLLLSFLLSLGVTSSILSLIRKTFELNVSLKFLDSVTSFAVCLLFLILLSIVCGWYPAVMAANTLQTRNHQRGVRTKTRSQFRARQGLVVFQFFISSVFISGTLIIFQQTHFLQNLHLGFEKEQVIAIRLSDEKAQKNYLTLKNELLSESSVVDVALSSSIPGNKEFYSLSIKSGGDNSSEYTIKSLGVDEDFLRTYNIELLEGREFSSEISTDQVSAFILNETAVRKLNLEQAIGSLLEMSIYTDERVVRKGRVIGIVKDFHFASLYEAVEPLVIYINKHQYYSDYLSVRLTEDSHLVEEMNMLSEKWEQFNGGSLFQYQFIDQNLNQLYKSEILKSKLLKALTTTTVLLSCMGLFGLSFFNVQKRTKEVGIRRVLGAGEASIVKLLSNEYLILITLASLLSIPFVVFFANQWLENFAYRIHINAGIFVGTLAILLFLALITVSYQLWKAVKINPAKTLQEH